MCGHVGIAGDLRYKDEALIKRLLLFDFVRGEDGIGLLSVRNNGDTHLVKTAANPLEFFDMGRFKTVCQGSQSAVLLGHNRAATRGVKNSVNSHPYEFGHIIGAHNGTLENSCTKELEAKLGETFPVDSMAIFASIEKFGIEETIPMLQGAWSLVWWDKQDATLNFIRNDKRPMWHGYSKDCKTLFWASEWPILDAAVSTIGHNVSATPATEMWKHPERGFRYSMTKVDTLYSFDMTTLSKGGDGPVDAEMMELKGKEPPPVVNTYTGGHGNFPRPTGTTTTSTTSTSMGRTVSRVITGPSRKEQEKDKASKRTSSVVYLDDPDENPYGSFITKERFSELTYTGCSWCGESIKYGEAGITVYDRHDTILCPKCSGGSSSGNAKLYLLNLPAVA